MSKEWDPTKVDIGRSALVMITDEMVAGMKAGSITVDLAADDKDWVRVEHIAIS